MELEEATALADVFVTRLLFKLHSLPRDGDVPWAMAWWKKSGSGLPLRKALDEAKAHLSHFAVHQSADKVNKRSLYLTLSAFPADVDAASCSALKGGRCGIYERRPLSCRTVPFHYSRPASTLPNYLDSFVRTPGYACDTAQTAPAILDQAVERSRAEAVALNAAGKHWRQEIVARMKGPETFGLPTYDDVVRNASVGATSVPMTVAWAVARDAGLLAQSEFDRVERAQAKLLRVR